MTDVFVSVSGIGVCRLMTVLRLIALLAIAAFAALPSVAGAQGGNTAVEGYVEQLPKGGGDDQADDTSNASALGEDGPLTPTEVADLESVGGADGAAAAQLAQSTAPERQDGASGGPAEPAQASDSGLAEVVGDVAGGDDSGVGLLLPLVLVAAVIGAIAFVVVRRRGERADSA